MRADRTTVPAGDRPPRFDAVEIGPELGPARLVVDRHLLDAYVFATEDRTACDPVTGEITPALLANELLLLYYYRYRQPDCASVHTHNELFLHQPIRAGAEVTVTGRHIDKFVRRGRGMVVGQSEAHLPDGSRLAANIATEIMDGVQERTNAVGGKTRTGSESAEPVDSSATHHLSRPARFDQVAVFSNLAKHQINIHNDVAFARSRGFGKPVVQGLHQAAWLSELGLVSFGRPYWRGGELRTTFLRPLFADDVAQVYLGPARSQNGAKVATGWVRNGAGQLTTIASVTVTSHRVQENPL